MTAGERDVPVKRAQRMPLAPELVGTAMCVVCHERTMKLPGHNGGVCIECYAREANADVRIARASHSWMPANFVGCPCLACGSEDVDANGFLFWCANCRMVTRVA
ncbi:hypothetical protein [Streptomyces albireticuli]|uniref:hypothetical protein n=1 Tax=Streptomyces albireticuli TaxID=1940 RepID=UPI0036B7C218